ncbi:MAG: hypothetical protein HYX72_07170 [Acidobacteria bacterium]|nr:hypothetical protein [Acidobacteriota bacterium]
MARVRLFRNRAGGLGILALLALIATVVLWGAGGQLRPAQKATGQPQLVSVEPLPQADGERCEWEPASAANSSLFASFQQQFAPPAADVTEAEKLAASRRKPIRVINDPWGAFSAVAVDPIHNEVLMTDENKFRIVAYDRLENTPPNAKLSEPKRMIHGEDTEIEFQCSLYIDPANGDIYAVNNDTLGKMAVFPHGANGNAKPARYLNTPMATFGVAVDERTQELMLTVQDDAAVVTFKKTATGKDSPIRTLQGPRTLMADPHGIAYNPKTDQIYVSNWGSVNVHKRPASGKYSGTLNRGIGRDNWPVGRNDAVPGSGKFMPPSITVYPRDASWDTPPIRVIQGPRTQLNWPTALSIDHERGELYVANDPVDSVLVFKADANGDVAPIRVLKGPKTLIKNPTSVFADLKNQELWVANFGNHTATVYKLGASGDAPPLRVIRSGPIEAPAPMMGNPHTLTWDSKRDELLVAN